MSGHTYTYICVLKHTYSHEKGMHILLLLWPPIPGRSRKTILSARTLYIALFYSMCSAVCEQYKVGRLHIQLFGGSIEYLMRCSVLIISGRTGRVTGAAGGRMMLKLTLFLTNIFILFVHQQNSSYFDRYLKKTSIILNY